MKKILICMVVLTLTAGLLLIGISCKEPEVIVETVTETVTETVEVEKEAEEVADGPVVVYWQDFWAHEDTFRPGIMKMIERFEETHPNIKVEIIDVSYEETLTQTMLAASAGNAADVIQLVASFTNTIDSMGALEDLGNWFTEEELADIPKATLDSSYRKGKLISMPYAQSSIVVQGNKALLEQAGLPLEIPETLAEFKEAIKKISDLGEGIYGFGCRTSKDQNSALWFLPALWAHGGQFEDEDGQVVLDSPETIDTLNWYKEIGTTKQTPVGLTSREIRVLFGQNKIGFMLDGPWVRTQQRNFTELGEAADDIYINGLMPKAVDGNRYHLGNSVVLCMSKQSEVKPEAAELIRFMTQDEEARAGWFLDTFQMPVHKEMLKESPYTESDFAAIFAEAAETANSNPSENPNFNSALEFIATMMQQALLGGDVEQALDDAVFGIKTLYGQD